MEKSLGNVTTGLDSAALRCFSERRVWLSESQDLSNEVMVVAQNTAA